MSQLKIKEKKNHFAFLGNFITILILVVAIGVCAYAGGNLYKIFSEYKAGTDEYAKISDMVVTEKKADVKDETWVDKETKRSTVKNWRKSIRILSAGCMWKHFRISATRWCITRIMISICTGLLRSRIILQGLFLLTVRTKGTWETAIPTFMDIT